MRKVLMMALLAGIASCALPRKTPFMFETYGATDEEHLARAVKMYEGDVTAQGANRDWDVDGKPDLYVIGNQGVWHTMSGYEDLERDGIFRRKWYKHLSDALKK